MFKDMSNEELIELHKKVAGELMNRLLNEPKTEEIPDEIPPEIEEPEPENEEEPENEIVETATTECKHEWLGIPGTDDEICMLCNEVRKTDNK